MLNNQVGAASKVYGFTKRTFYLLINTMMLKNGLLVFMQLNNILQVGRYFMNV